MSLYKKNISRKIQEITTNIDISNQNNIKIINSSIDFIDKVILGSLGKGENETSQVLINGLLTLKTSFSEIIKKQEANVYAINALQEVLALAKKDSAEISKVKEIIDEDEELKDLIKLTNFPNQQYN